MTLEYFQSSTLTVKVSVLFYLQQTRHASALTSRREEAIRITLDYAHLLAARKLMRDSPEACISTFKTALEANPSHPNASYALGIAYLEQNKWETSRPYLARALKLATAEARKAVIRDWLRQSAPPPRTAI